MNSHLDAEVLVSEQIAESGDALLSDVLIPFRRLGIEPLHRLADVIPIPVSGLAAPWGSR